MASDAVKLARIARQTAQDQFWFGMMRDLVSNKPMQIVLAIAAIEAAQQVRPDGVHQLISDNWGSALEAALLIEPVLKELMKETPKVLTSIGDTAGKITPLLLAAGG